MTSKTRKCEVCRNWIEADRLEAVPQTHLCIRHGGEIDKYGGEFRAVATVKSTSKGGSFKVNPTDVSAKLVRNERALEKLIRDFENETLGG